MPIDPNLKDIYVFYGEQIPNYFNRRIFYYASLLDYVTAAGVDHYELKEDVNFNPADGVSTVLDVNSDLGDKFTYLLVVDPEDSSILSRWFIIEADRNLGGQYRLTLRRDVVAESISNINFLTQAPIYVEKGILFEGDPFSYLPEGISFNQIKKSERRISQIQFGTNRRYNLNWGWIVGYFERGASVAQAEIQTGQLEPESYETASSIASKTGISLDKVNDLLSGITIPFCVSNLNFTYGVWASTNQFFYGCKASMINRLNGGYAEMNWAITYSEFIGGISDPEIDLLAAVFRGMDYLTSDINAFKNALTDVINNDVAGEEFYNLENYNSLIALEGKIVNVGGSYYTIHIPDKSTTPHNRVEIAVGENAFFDGMMHDICYEVRNTGIVHLDYDIRNIGIELQPYEYGQSYIRTKISSSSQTLRDAPYNMFAIPFGDEVYYATNPVNPEDNLTKLDKWTAFKLASKIATELGAKLYDLQLLPYIPYTEFMPLGFKHIEGSSIPRPYLNLQSVALEWNETDQDYVDTGYEGVAFDYIEDSNSNKLGAIFYLESSNFEFNIDYAPLSNLRLIAKDEEKVEANCNFYRIVSPNYSGIFEFNLAKNDMSVDGFNVTCTYKPYNPFIRVQPQFKGIYGTTFLDGRGLICGGDFSLPIISDPWINYEQNNKNFANIFAREIQNLDVTQKQEALKEAISLGTGVAGGGVGGAVAGAKVGGAYGAIAGATIGTTAGGVGAYIDAALGRERRAEAKDYMIDRFNMNLQSIKALPQSLAKNSAFNLINKIQPFVEYYTCTDEEKEAFRRKIEYDGMTVGRIDYIGNFASTGYEGLYYFKGQLIRAVGIEEDTHYINALYEELAKGVYI